MKIIFCFFCCESVWVKVKLNKLDIAFSVQNEANKKRAEISAIVDVDVGNGGFWTRSNYEKHINA